MRYRSLSVAPHVVPCVARLEAGGSKCPGLREPCRVSLRPGRPPGLVAASLAAVSKVRVSGQGVRGSSLRSLGASPSPKNNSLSWGLPRVEYGPAPSATSVKREGRSERRKEYTPSAPWADGSGRRGGGLRPLLSTNPLVSLRGRPTEGSP